ncbi:MAG TPA: hypothetical protein VHY08_25725 [Bacillota bacterium]|nr:hypothetical protein [Bacillota bacterium]
MLNKQMLSIINPICAAVILIMVIFLVIRLIKIFAGKRILKTKGIKGLIFIIISLGILGAVEYCLYHIPDFLMYGIPWEMIDEMGPTGFIPAVILLGTLLFIIFTYLILSFFFVKSSPSQSKMAK